jgi:hypothetical protein
MKMYIKAYKSRESVNHMLIDYWFCATPTDALWRADKTIAEDEIMAFNRGITINKDIQRPHLLTNFQIERFNEGYVIWCDGPFEIRGEGTAPGNE